jgi:NADH-quinone oxidoreductase subunit C
MYAGIDYLTYGQDEWTTESATESGFSRGVDRNPVILDEADSFDPRRFAVVYHLLSLHHNARLRVACLHRHRQPADCAFTGLRLEFS